MIPEIRQYPNGIKFAAGRTFGNGCGFEDNCSGLNEMGVFS